MKFRTTIGLCALGALLLFGCAKKKEEAAKLEQELIEQESLAMAESLADAGAVPPESVAVEVIAADVDAVPQEEPGFVPGPPPGSGFTVQVAACENLEYARYLIELFADRGYEPYLSNTVLDGQTYHRVRVGAFEGHSEAKALMDELIDRYSVTAWIDVID